MKGSVVGQSWVFVPTSIILLCAEVHIFLLQCTVRYVVYTESTVFTNNLTHKCTLGRQSLCVCEVSDTYVLGCLRYTEKYGKHILISCGCVVVVYKCVI